MLQVQRPVDSAHCKLLEPVASQPQATDRIELKKVICKSNEKYLLSNDEDEHWWLSSKRAVNTKAVKNHEVFIANVV